MYGVVLYTNKSCVEVRDVQKKNLMYYFFEYHDFSAFVTTVQLKLIASHLAFQSNSKAIMKS